MHMLARIVIAPSPALLFTSLRYEKIFFRAMIYIFISCMQSHSHAFVQVFSAMLYNVCRPCTQQILLPPNIN